MSFSLPVGTILAFCSDNVIAPLPSSWMLCKGTQLSQAQYPDLFKMIGHANDPLSDADDQDQAFFLPDLTGRFLRGSAPNSRGEKPAGYVSDFATGGIDITVTVDQMSDDNWHMIYDGDNDTRVPVSQYNADSTVFNVININTETRPINMAMNWIIKVLPDTSNEPVGSIFPWAGANSNRPEDPPAFLRCDGGNVVKSSVAQLSKVTADRFQVLGSDNLFYTPDLTGKFIRGDDPNGSVDTEAGSRLPTVSGESAGFGTWQRYGTYFKDAKVTIPHYNSQTVTSYKTNGNDCIGASSSAFKSNQTWKGGDVESRPANAAAHFYISSGVGSKEFPIGGIIAIPGAGFPDSTHWLPCDGRWIDNLSTYPALRDALAFCWGNLGDKSKGYFLPDFVNKFIRAADNTGHANGDPAWNQRSDIEGRNSSHISVGSYQESAVALPIDPKTFDPNTKALPLRINISYPDDIIDTCYALRETYAGNHNGPGTYDMSYASDAETYPKHVVVNYYIRVQ